MSYTKTILVAGVFVLVGLAYAGSDLYQKKVITDKVAQLMNDPESAKFENIKHYSKSKATCGWVNAKNRMGGYGEKRPFIVFQDGEVRIAPQRDLSDFKADDENKYMELLVANCPEIYALALSSPRPGKSGRGYQKARQGNGEAFRDVAVQPVCK
jgi:hypothetical protein